MGFRGRALVGALVALAAVAVTTSAAWGAAGDRDTSFGNGAGFVNINYAALVPNAIATADTASAVAVQRDGRIVIGGSSDAAGTSDMAVVRLTGAGAIDTSYGLGTGGSRINFGALVPNATSSNDQATALVLQPDGKILLGGVSDAAGTHDMAVVRLNSPAGTLDASYGLGTGGSRIDFGGLVPNATGSDDEVGALALQPDGKIVVVGASDAVGGYDMAVVRVNSPAGTLDASYGLGTGGSRIDFSGLVPNATGHTDFGAAVALQPDGKIVVAGDTNAAGTGDLAVVRLLSPQGTLDTSYGLGTGGSRVDVGSYVAGGTSADDTARAMVLQPDGKILVAGDTEARGTADFAVVRLRSPQGTLDPSFGADGHGAAVIDLGGDNPGQSMALQANGKIVVAGTIERNGQLDPAVIRLQPNGTLDTSFGDHGERNIEMPGRQAVSGLAIAPDGKVVVVGTTGAGAVSDMFAARLQGDPASQGGGPSGGGGKGKTLRCAGKRATVIGTNRKNRLKGTKRADVIAGLGGNDKIDGRGGNDVICAGDGNDSVAGGDGKDRLYGQNGKDTLKGGTGNDSLDGGSGNDKLYGQSGKDTLRGRAGHDRLAGGPGKDKQKQ
jgi:uncharacterized delta-60 repeat protein